MCNSRNVLRAWSGERQAKILLPDDCMEGNSVHSGAKSLCRFPHQLGQVVSSSEPAGGWRGAGLGELGHDGDGGAAEGQ